MQILSNISIINDLLTIILTGAVVSTPVKKKIVTVIKKSKSSGKITETKKITLLPKLKRK